MTILDFLFFMLGGFFGLIIGISLSIVKINFLQSKIDDLERK